MERYRVWTRVDHPDGGSTKGQEDFTTAEAAVEHAAKFAATMNFDSVVAFNTQTGRTLVGYLAGKLVEVGSDDPA